MEPLGVVLALNSGNDPELGSENYLSQSPDLDPPISDSNKDAGIYSELQKLKLKEEDREVGKDSDEGEVENVPEKIEERGGDGDSQNGWNYSIENENSGGWDWDSKCEVEKKDERSEGIVQYPRRPGAEDCSFYLKTGACKFGPHCKFNHPIWRNYQDKEDAVPHPRSTECKYYLKMGGCKFGKACRFNHTRPKESDRSVPELNFLGLPVRPGEKECPYYMRTGSCKYGSCCKFNHPEPTASDESNYQGLGEERLLSPYCTSESAITTWSSTGTGNETVPFVPVAQLYPSERSMFQPKGTAVNSHAKETKLPKHQQQQMQSQEFPERPGQPECSYFMRTGDCKYKYTCKYHHPQSRNLKSPPCILSDNGLPLRPGQNVCTFYSRYGICKFGPACKFDHPIVLEYSNRS